jgi:hypothetical protein
VRDCDGVILIATDGGSEVNQAYWEWARNFRQNSIVKTTERYLESLGVEDLQAVHDKLSLLTR